MKWKTLLAFGLSLGLLLTGCKKDKGGTSNDPTPTSEVHTQHEKDDYGFCKQGGEYLGVTLAEGVNRLETKPGEPTFFRFQGKTHAQIGFDFDENSTAEPVGFQYYVMENGLPRAAGENEMESFFSKETTENDYFYMKLSFNKEGFFILKVHYEHLHHGDSLGYCVDDGEYLGEQIDILNHMWTTSYFDAGVDENGEPADYFKFPFEQGADYGLYRKEDERITFSYFIKTGEGEAEEVDIGKLYETNAYARSVDHNIYIKTSFRQTGTSGIFTHFRITYKVDEYGFGADGVYRSNTWKDSDGSFNLMDANFKYDAGFRWCFRVPVKMGYVYSYANIDFGKYILRNYLRNAETHEMIYIDHPETEAPYTKENKDTYEPYLYYVIEFTGINDGYGNSFVVTEKPHAVHGDQDDYGFCEECGLYGGNSIALGETVSCGMMQAGDRWFGRVALEAGKKYYKTYTNFAASEIKFYGIIDGGFQEQTIGIQSHASTAVQTDDGYYYVVVTASGGVDGSFTINALSE